MPALNLYMSKAMKRVWDEMPPPEKERVTRRLRSLLRRQLAAPTDRTSEGR